MWRRGLFVTRSFHKIAGRRNRLQQPVPVTFMEIFSSSQSCRRALFSSILPARIDVSLYEPFPALCRFQHSEAAVADHEEETAATSPFEKKMNELMPLLQVTADDSFEKNLDLILDGEDELMVAILAPGANFQSFNYYSVIRFINWAVERNKHQASEILTPSMIETLVRNILSKSTVSQLWKFVKKCALEFNVVPSDVSLFNKFIYYFSQQANGEDILEIFTMISQLGFSPDSESYYLTIVALCKASCYDQACSICHKMLESEALPEAPSKIGYLIRLLCKADQATLAHLVYSKARKMSRQSPFNDFSLLISFLTRKDETVKLAADSLYDLPEKDLNVAHKLFYLVVCGLCRVKDLDEANKLLSRMISSGPPPGNNIFNRIIVCSSKKGDMEGALRSMQLMESRGLRPDVYTYTVIISGFVRSGRMKEAREILSLAKKNHSKLTKVTYHSLIRGYCKLDQFDEALKLLGEMKDFGVIPNVDEYNKLIQSLCLKSLDWQTSEKLFQEMEENGLHLNGITKGLIRAVKELEQETKAPT